jgi:hypothetical protein
MFPRQDRHVLEGNYEKEASRRKHKQDCHDRTGMLKRTATRRKPVEGSIKNVSKTGHWHVVEASYEKEASRREHKEECPRQGMDML